MALSDVLPDDALDFSELDDEGSTPASEGPLTGSRGTRGRSASASSSEPREPRRRAPTQKRKDALSEKLSEQMFMAGTLTGFALPVTGYYVCQESANFCRAVVDLAAMRPEWIAALEKLALLEPGLIVGRTALGVGGALAVDRGRAKPDSRVMMVLGVHQAWLALQEEGEYASRSEGASYTPPPAPRFQPVG